MRSSLLDLVEAAIPDWYKIRAAIRIAERIHQDEKGCWIWVGARVSSGYGSIQYGDQIGLTAHRVVYELLEGRIPAGLTLDHQCRVRACVNPAHLVPMTFAENIRIGGQGGTNRRKTHCPRGHSYDAENTYIDGRGSRTCRTCRRNRPARDAA